MPPTVGAYYQCGPQGPIVQVEAVAGPHWLARFVYHPVEHDRANHRQWMPWWKEGSWFREVPPQANVGAECTCMGCEEGKALGRWPSIVPIGT